MSTYPAVDTREVGPYMVEILHDEDPMSPREWDNIGRFVGLNSWTFNDHPADSVGDAYREARTGGPILALPVKVLDGPYTIVEETDDWSYADGIYWAAIDETEAVADHGIRTIPGLRAVLRSELADLNLYLAGDSYGYVVKGPGGEVLDSCWGYLGEASYAMSEGVDVAEWHAFKAACDWAALPEWVQQYVLIREER